MTTASGLVFVTNLCDNSLQEAYEEDRGIGVDKHRHGDFRKPHSRSRGDDGANAGIYVDASADAIVRNCISVGNTAAGGETTKNFMLADGASVSHCCSPDLEDGVNGNVSADPQFKTINGFDYGFRSTSPCFSAGEKLDWMKGALDYLGQPRLVNAPEIGCFESQVKGFMLMLK